MASLLRPSFRADRTLMKPYWTGYNSEIYVGDARSVLEQLPKGSVQTCITSPPYFRLRDYDHDDQIGQEDTPEEFISQLVDVFSRVRDVLRDDGTLWINIADTYMTSNKRPKNSKNKYKIKDMLGIPWQLAFALREDGWYLRQDIIWNKTNARPENAKGRCDGSHEYLFLLSKSKTYRFNEKAIQVPSVSAGRVPGGNKKNDASRNDADRDMTVPVAPMRNRRSVWDIATQGIKAGHFAPYPIKLIEPCIQATCDRDSIVLDPFLGSGTTIEAAMRFGCHGVGIELNTEYADIAVEELEPISRAAKQDVFS